MPVVDVLDPKASLQRYLQQGRDAVLWKLDGLGEYEVRRPMTPTGTNLLGLVKHLTFVELGYFGATFGRPLAEAVTWLDLPEDDETVDLWATRAESRAAVVAGYRRACAHADETIAALPLDARGHVEQWPAERNPVTLLQLMTHVIAETHRHAGHADIVRESIDGAVGMRAGNDNMVPGDGAFWAAHVARLEQVARDAAGT